MRGAQAEMERSAKLLDRYYIPARYPNGWPSGYPGELIMREDAEIDQASAKVVLDFCENSVSL